MQDLRYGENPHQRAAFYSDLGSTLYSVAAARKLQGKELSFNNILDLDAAWRLVTEFARSGLRDRQAHEPLRHRRWARTSHEAYAARLGVRSHVRLRRHPGLQPHASTPPPRARLAEVFVEAVIAPGFEAEAKEALAAKKNLRVMDMDTTSIHRVTGFDLRRVMGGLLVQEWDLHRLERAQVRGGHAAQARPTRSGRRWSWPGRWSST